MTVYEAEWVCAAPGVSIQSGALSVENGAVVQVGRAAEFPAAQPRISFSGCAIIPGFVNAHAHLELTLLRGYLENLSFREWILRLTEAKYRSLDRHALKISAQLGAIEMLRAGVTAVGEVMDIGTGLEAMEEFGLRGIAYQEVFGPAESAADEAMRGLTAKVEAYRGRETASRKVGISPHAPYSVSGRLYEAVRDFARTHKLPMTAHVAESAGETSFVRDGEGPFADGLRHRGIEVVPRHCLPVAYLDGLGLLGPDMLLIHAIEADDEDLERISRSGATVVHCPKSNAKLGHRTARVAEMRSRNVCVGLGTDSVVSNNVVDMFEEMRAAVSGQRTRTGRLDSMTAADAFRMATIDAARCLGLENQVGSLEPGKRADFVVVDLSGVATQPVFDPIETMVYSACRADVKATFIDGREAALDEAETLKEVRKISYDFLAKMK